MNYNNECKYIITSFESPKIPQSVPLSLEISKKKLRKGYADNSYLRIDVVIPKIDVFDYHPGHQQVQLCQVRTDSSIILERMICMKFWFGLNRAH